MPGEVVIANKHSPAMTSYARGDFPYSYKVDPRNAPRHETAPAGDALSVQIRPLDSLPHVQNTDSY